MSFGLPTSTDDLRTLFELTKLDTLFQISDTRDRALSSILIVFVISVARSVSRRAAPRRPWAFCHALSPSLSLP